MLDSVKILTNVSDVNLFNQGDEPAVVRAGMANDLYFRLWAKDRSERYVPATAATLTITFPRSFSVGSSSSSSPAADQTFTVNATNPFTDDRSIWKVALTSSQSNLVAGGGVVATLTEGLKISKFYLGSVIQKLSSSGV